MKNYSKFTATTLAVMLVATGVGVAAQQAVGGVTKANYQFEVEGKDLKLPGNLLVLSKDNSTYVPLRFLSESMGAKVEFNQGKISIGGLTKSGETNKSDKEKLDSALREVELLKKENAELQKKIALTDNKLVDANAYRKLPTYVEDSAGLKVELRRVAMDSNAKGTYSITISNSDNNNTFYFLPEKAELTIDGKTYTASNYSSELISTLASRGSSLGASVIDGDLQFASIGSANKKGSLTLYYNVNSSADKRSKTIFFDYTA